MNVRTIVKAGAGIAIGAASMGLLMAWLAGAFVAKVEPAPPAPPTRLADEAATEVIAPVTVPVFREAIGTIRAQHETAVASMILGRVAEVRVSAGQEVAEGEVIVRLQDAEHRARLAAAEADLGRARDLLARIEKQRAGGAATERQLVEARTATEAAAARVAEAQAYVDYTVVRSPMTGVVIDHECSVGDTVRPGQTLVRLFDRLQLVASVPESLLGHIAVGQEVPVRVDAVDETCTGRVTEIVPQARPLSRAFDVKVTGACKSGLIPGMFGRLRIRIGEREELRVPARAVRRVGQVAVVMRVTADGALVRQFVHLGDRVGDRQVVLSGLAAGDRILADASAAVSE